MDVHPLSIEGAWVFTPRQATDERGIFLESFAGVAFAEAVGHPLAIAQVNVSVSRQGTLRGVHFADVPPSQAKYVTCVGGAVLDVVVDIRVGSPTFGAICHVQLDDVGRRAIYLAEGLGHAFYALSENATVSYLCSTPYAPGREHGINPLDPAISWPWPIGGEMVISKKDRDAPTLAEAAASGLLPEYADCRALYARNRRRAR